MWYVLEGTLDRPAARFLLLNGLLFEVFRDQQSIVELLRMPQNSRRTLCYTAVDPRHQSLDF